MPEVLGHIQRNLALAHLCKASEAALSLLPQPIHAIGKVILQVVQNVLSQPFIVLLVRVCFQSSQLKGIIAGNLKTERVCADKAQHKIDHALSKRDACAARKSFDKAKCFLTREHTKPQERENIKERRAQHVTPQRQVQEWVLRSRHKSNVV